MELWSALLGALVGGAFLLGGQWWNLRAARSDALESTDRQYRADLRNLYASDCGEFLLRSSELALSITQVAVSIPSWETKWGDWFGDVRDLYTKLTLAIDVESKALTDAFGFIEKHYELSYERPLINQDDKEALAAFFAAARPLEAEWRAHELAMCRMFGEFLGLKNLERWSIPSSLRI